MITNSNKRKLIYIFLVLILFNYSWFIIFDHSVESYFYTISISSAFYLVSVLLLNRVDVEIKYIFWIIAVFFIFKILALGILPVGSDDYYRYLWDGKLLVNGINPFQYPPNSMNLMHLHSDLLPAQVTYPEIKTIYFPLSQVAFATAYLICGESIGGLKIIILLSDILITIGLFLLLKRFAINFKYVLIYAASPLIFYQFIIDAHIDILGIMFLLFSIYFLKDKKLLSALLLAASLMVKPTFLIAVPIFFLHEKKFNDKMKMALVPIVLLGISFIPFAFDTNPFDTLINYTRHWSFNGAAFNLLTIFFSNTFTIRLILLITFALIYLLLLMYYTNVLPLLYYSLIFFLLLSPVVHPWYAAWLIVLLAVYPRLSGLTYVSLISLTFYTVMVYQTKGIWKDYTLILLFQYIPVITLLIYELFFDKKEEYSGSIIQKEINSEKHSSRK